MKIYQKDKIERKRKGHKINKIKWQNKNKK